MKIPIDRKGINLCEECTEEYMMSIAHIFKMLVLAVGRCGVCKKRNVKVIRANRKNINL